MTGLLVLGVGIALFMLAIGISINTSMGGTRSDHDDGSTCLFLVAICVCAAGTLMIAPGILT